jgi:hypothetical protein
VEVQPQRSGEGRSFGTTPAESCVFFFFFFFLGMILYGDTQAAAPVAVSTMTSHDGAQSLAPGPRPHSAPRHARGSSSDRAMAEGARMARRSASRTRRPALADATSRPTTGSGGTQPRLSVACGCGCVCVFYHVDRCCSNPLEARASQRQSRSALRST